MDFHIAEIDLGADSQGPWSSFWEGVADLERESGMVALGYDDMAPTDTPARVAAWRDQRDGQASVLLAVAGRAPAPAGAGSGHRSLPARGETTVAPDAVLGTVVAGVSVHDNTHLGNVSLTVRPAARLRGVGRALLDAAEAYLRHEGRTTFFGWSVVTAGVTDDPDGTVSDPTGTIHVSTKNEAVRFALAHGYAFSQAGRHSIQSLPVPEEVLASALIEGQAKGQGYELVQFAGTPAGDLMDGLVPLFAAMSTDPPLGEVDARPQVWDEARVLRAYEQMTIGADVFTTMARHVATGEAAAFTQLLAPHHKPDVVEQANTLVLARHRGHALGLWMKAANCAYISRERPTSRRVHTWNADDNGHMIAINTRLGYRRDAIAAGWQKVLR